MLLPLYFVRLMLLPFVFVLAGVIAKVADVIATSAVYWLVLLPWWLDVKSTHECRCI